MSYIHGLIGSISNAGGGIPPSAPQYFAFDHAQQGLLSTATRVNLSAPASAGTMPVIGYKYYRDGSLIHTTTGTSSADQFYVHTGLTTGTTYSYTATAYSAVGESPHTAAISFKNPQAATVGFSTTGMYRYFPSGTRNQNINRPNVDGEGFVVYQIYGNGNWWIQSNPDSAPITVLMVGGGGGTYAPWNPKGGAGGGALFVLDEVTNLQDLGTGSSYGKSVTIGAGAAYNSSYSGGITQCSHLFYNGGTVTNSGSWDTIYCGGGQTGTANIQYGGSGKGADINMNASAGYHTTNQGTGHQVTSPTTYKGGNGGQSHSSGGQNPSLGYQASGGGGGSYFSSGWAGANGWSYSSGASGGGGGQGYYFASNKGWGGIHNNNGSYYFLTGIAGGAGGTSWGYSGYQPSYVPTYGSGTHGGGHGTAARYATYFGQLTTVWPNGQDMQGNWSSSSIYCQGMAASGGGGGSILNGTVQGGNGGSGAMYIRLHT